MEIALRRVYADFGVCEWCIEGHCGALPGLNAESWLAKQVKELQPEHFDLL